MCHTPRVPGSEGLEWGPKTHISNKFPGDADGAVLRLHTENHWIREWCRKENGEGLKESVPQPNLAYRSLVLENSQCSFISLSPIRKMRHTNSKQRTPLLNIDEIGFESLDFQLCILVMNRAFQS